MADTLLRKPAGSLSLKPAFVCCVRYYSAREMEKKVQTVEESQDCIFSVCLAASAGLMLPLSVCRATAVHVPTH
jgi:hypothetical protein